MNIWPGRLFHKKNLADGAKGRLPKSFGIGRLCSASVIVWLELYAENIYVVGRTLEILNCLKKSQKKKSLFLGMSLHKNKSKFQNTWCLNWQGRTSPSLNFIHGRGHRRKTWHVIKQIKWQYSTFSKYLYMTVENYIKTYVLCMYFYPMICGTVSGCMVCTMWLRMHSSNIRLICNNYAFWTFHKIHLILNSM